MTVDDDDFTQSHTTQQTSTAALKACSPQGLYSKTRSCNCNSLCSPAESIYTPSDYDFKCSISINHLKTATDLLLPDGRSQPVPMFF